MQITGLAQFVSDLITENDELVYMIVVMGIALFSILAAYTGELGDL